MARGTKLLSSKHFNGSNDGYSRQDQNLHLTQVQRPEDLSQVRESWRRLAGGAPMQSPEWLLTWIEYYITSDDELCVLLFHDSEDNLVGLAPLFIQKSGGTTTFRLLGSGDACTNHTTWLSAPGWETEIGSAVAQFLLDNKQDWDCLHFEWIDEDDVAVNTTIAGLQENGCLLRQAPLNNCWKITLPSNWDDYLQILSRKHRKQCRRLQRKYLESGKVKIHTVQRAKELPNGFKTFLRLHAARWNDLTKPQGVFSDQRFLSFHEKVAHELLKGHQLHLTWLEYEDKPIAAEYQFVDQNTVYAYQAGMDPSFKVIRPGQLSIIASIQFAIERGCRSYDLLRGDEPYKAHYRATPVACKDIRIWPEGISGRLDYTLHYTKSRIRYYTGIGRYLATQWLNKGPELNKN